MLLLGIYRDLESNMTMNCSFPNLALGYFLPEMESTLQAHQFLRRLPLLCSGNAVGFVSPPHDPRRRSLWNNFQVGVQPFGSVSASWKMWTWGRRPQTPGVYRTDSTRLFL